MFLLRSNPFSRGLFQSFHLTINCCAQDGWSPAILDDYGGGSVNGDRRRIAHEDDSTLNEDDDEEVDDGGGRFNNINYAHRSSAPSGGNLQSDSETDRGGTPVRWEEKI